MGFWDKLLPRDCIAGLMIIGGLTLKALGYNGYIDMILIGIAASYFGAELFKETKRE